MIILTKTLNTVLHTTQVQTVAILADAAEPDGTSVAQPACNALEGDLSWRVIYRAPVDAVMACEAVVYARIGEQ